MGMFYKTIAELVKKAESLNCPISTIVIENQAKELEVSEEELIKQMDKNWSVMIEAMERGINKDVKSVSGLTGGDAKKLHLAHLNGSSISGGPVMEAVAEPSCS